ncbi:MAG: NlpC/P60 family protein [Pseudomonadota bacterium]
MRPELKPFARRLIPARPDLAAAHLSDRFAAERYETGISCRVVVPILDLSLSPEQDSGLATQLLYGEPFTVYEDRADGVAWGQSGWDGYVGYVLSAGLTMASSAPSGETVRITAKSSHVYGQPDVKAPVQAALPMLAEVQLDERTGTFARIAAGGGFVPSAHLADCPGDPVDHARQFLASPYLWGGRSYAGLDCSALVQLAHLAAGHEEVPRDSDMQEALFGIPVAALHDLRRGDLIFWRGHVAICAGSGAIIHANAHHMAVVEEPLVEALTRIEASGGGVPTKLSRPPRLKQNS